MSYHSLCGKLKTYWRNNLIGDFFTITFNTLKCYFKIGLNFTPIDFYEKQNIFEDRG
jgi:hypothetical protein